MQDDGENRFYVRHTSDRIYLTSIYMFGALYNDDNELALCANKRIRPRDILTFAYAIYCAVTMEAKTLDRYVKQKFTDCFRSFPYVFDMILSIRHNHDILQFI